MTIRSTFPPPTPDVPNPEADHNFIGPDFYALSGNFPAGTTFHWGINLEDLNLTETVAQAALLQDTFTGSRKDLTSHVRLANIEIGNEPDFYGNAFPLRPGRLGAAWTVANYSSTWSEFAAAVGEKIQLGTGDDDELPRLSPGAFAGIAFPYWSAPSAYQAGLLDNEEVRSHVDQWADHSYFGQFRAGSTWPSGGLMNKATIRSNFSTKAAWVDATRAQGLKYVLGETNSYAK